MMASRQHLDSHFLTGLLQSVCGQPLTAMWRAVGQVFEFGAQRPTSNRRGEPITQGDFALKLIWADWRIVQGGRIILGSSDQDDDTWFYKSEQPASSQYDEHARKLAHEFLANVASGRHIAESISVSELADIKILLSDDLVIESFGSSGEDKDLWWCHDLRTDVSCLVGPSGYNFGQSEENSQS